MVSGTPHGICKLCGIDGKRSASHIVPEFCYRYEEKVGGPRHGLALLVPKENTDSIQESRFQKGLREYLLCPRCERLINERYEQAFDLVWKEKVLSRAPYKCGQLLNLDNIDCHRTKLFILSVFWRASISGVFGQVMDLGAYSERLRRILLNDLPVGHDQYPFLGRLILDSRGEPFMGCVTQPASIRTDGVRGYSMCFAGCDWQVIMNDHHIPRSYEALTQVLRDGQLKLLTVHHSEVGFLRMMSSRLREEDPERESAKCASED